jgi:hypothetical protein
MKSLRKLALVAAAFATASLRAQTNSVIYADGLQNGWDNWSWATNNIYNTSPVHSGTDSISANCGYYQAVALENAGFFTGAYTNLSLWMNGGAAGGQVITIVALVGGNQGPNYTLPALTPNTWQQFNIPLTALDAGGNSDLTEIYIWNYSPNTLPVFYIDDISLTGSGAPPPPNPTNYIGIDAGTNRHPISPLIYGTAFATSNQMIDLNFTMNRSGGNEESTYNWKINAHGKGADYYYESYPDDSSTPGESSDAVVAASKAAGAQALITVPMMSWGPRLGANRAILPSYSPAKYGPQTGFDPYFTNAGNGVSVTNDTEITWNDPNDSYTPVDTNFQKTYVQHLTGKWGFSTNGGVEYYIMDNEHSLWSSTHRDIHPIGPTMQEILGKMESYASMVKSVDSNALVLGPEEWGWPGYFYSGYDQQWSGSNNDYNTADYPDRATNGGWDYMPWLLNHLYQYQTNTGQRLLDYFTLHCYPQEGEVGTDAADSNTELLRNRTTRQFWDTNYLDPSWINSVIMLIPRMKNWVAAYYPGTKIGVTEYNWGAEGSISGGTAQADILGIFGREGLDLATRWTTPVSNSMPCYQAMKIYRNYDGHKSTFGDTSVFAAGPNPDSLAVFAAQRTADGALTIMVVSKYLTGAAPLAINLTNYIGAGVAHVWQISSTNLITQLSDVNCTNGLLQTTVPGQSVTLLVIPPRSGISLLPGAPRKDGQFEFWTQGEVGETFVLQSSTNLPVWTPVSTNSFTGPQYHFLLTAPASRVFYRAVLTSL